jgi:hypothetical protein
MFTVSEETQKAFERVAIDIQRSCEIVRQWATVSPWAKQRRAHEAYCKVRSLCLRSFETVQLSLAQVAQVFTLAISPTSHTPPGQLSARSVLATCHASNAPGLSPVSRHWQVSP